MIAKPVYFKIDGALIIANGCARGPTTSGLISFDLAVTHCDLAQ